MRKIVIKFNVVAEYEEGFFDDEKTQTFDDAVKFIEDEENLKKIKKEILEDLEYAFDKGHVKIKNFKWEILE